MSRVLLPPPAVAEPADQVADAVDDTPRPDAAQLEAARVRSLGGGPRAPRPADPPGYRLRSVLGRGAFGTVWLATENATGKKAAVKLFRHVRALDWPLLTREVEKLAALDASRNVVRLLAVGWDADPPYYVMEYLPAGSLAAKLDACGPLPPEACVVLAEGIAAGLTHAHGSGILHCDLKPGNVLLDDDGAPRLCDFGQARGFGPAAAGGAGAAASDAGGPPLGTLFYMPPEQTLPGAAPDARWDVYALGAVLFECLTGSPPHRTNDLADRLRNIASVTDRLAAYRRLVAAAGTPKEHRDVRGVDAALAGVVDRCLAAEPAARFPNAQAVRNALRERAAARARRGRVRWATLAPAVLAAVLIPTGAVLARRSVDAARQQVVARSLDANALSARVVARSLEREVARKRADLEALAAAPELGELVADAAAEDWRGAASERLAAFLSARTDVAADPAKGGDVSWFLQDAAGVTRWRKPFDAAVVGGNFAYRDYFHGRDGDLPPDTTAGSVPPVGRTHVSLPYVSTSTVERKLAVSCPVRDGGRVVAVLARTVLLDALLAEYDTFKQGITGGDADDTDSRIERVIALYERRTGELLDHPYLAGRAASPDRTAGRLRAAERDRLAASGGTLRTAGHADPVAAADGGAAYAGPWLAAFAPVGGTDWVAVVQEPRGAALAAVESLRGVLLKTGVAVTLGVLVALAGVYAWLTRERPA